MPNHIWFWVQYWDLALANELTVLFGKRNISDLLDSKLFSRDRGLAR